MIVSLGEALIDLIHTEGESEPEARVGGSPYNVAIALARLEVQAGLVCPLSSDAHGDRLAQGLEDNGVHHCVRERVDAPTAVAEVFTNDSGHPRYVFHREGTADRALEQCPPSGSIPEETRALHFGSLVLAQESDWPAWREAIVAARSNGAFIAFDPNVRVSLIDDMDRYRARVEEAVHLTDLIKTSDEDLELLSPGHTPEQRIQNWRGADRTVVLTEGSRGAQIWTASGGHTVWREVENAAIVDTVGAGDTFQAALLAWLWHRNSFHAELTAPAAAELLRFATRAAGLNCTRAGCQPPTLHEVDGE